MDVELSPADRERYAGQIAAKAFSERGQQRLEQSRAIVIGAGPRGAGVAAGLAAAGVGYIGITDGGVVERRDLAGQTVHFVPDLGTNRADSVAAKLGVMNPDVHVDPYPVEVGVDNASAIVVGHDIVVSTVADDRGRLDAHDACVEVGIPFVDCIAWESDLVVTSVLAGRGGCLRCERRELKSGGASLPGLDGLAAAVAAREVIGILGSDSPQPLRFHFDADSGFSQGAPRRREGCPVCAEASVPEVVSS